MSTVNSQFFRLKHNMIVQSVMKGIWKMQNYRYRSPGNSRGCMRQPDSSRELCAGIALDQMPVTMAYVPWTKWRNIYEAEKGLRRGTIFQDLDKPFRGIGGCQNGR
ncbi:spore coat associated protein CotJA [Dorea formicigenerans]|uniref:Spore coat associated protein CotJA n=3 Tax=Lachnospiraceae TaxID=186803 RepID=A0A3E4PZD8_9FIRM|nr:spore coat associated protein CotJA [Dorea formicigenerans]